MVSNTKKGKASLIVLRERWLVTTDTHTISNSINDESPYIDSLRQKHNIKLSSYLLHALSHALKDLFMLNHETIIRASHIIVPQLNKLRC